MNTENDCVKIIYLACIYMQQPLLKELLEKQKLLKTRKKSKGFMEFDVSGFWY